MTASQTAYFVLLALFWGGSFLGIHYVVVSFPPALGAFMRVLIAFILVSTFLLFSRRASTPIKIKLQAMGTGILNMGISWILLFYGEKFIAPALASIYNSASTIFAALSAPLILAHASLNKRNSLGVAIGFIGILVIFVPHIRADHLLEIRGQFCVLGMALCYGMGVAWVKRYSHEIDSRTNLFYQCVGAMAVLGPFSLIFESPRTINFADIPSAAWLSLFYLAICSTFIAWLLFLRLIRERGAVQASSVTYLIPIFSIILDVIFLGKLVRPTDIFGMAVILGGVWLIQHRSAKN